MSYFHGPLKVFIHALLRKTYQAARADVLGAAQSGGGDEIATQGLHSTSPQEAAVERLVCQP